MWGPVLRAGCCVGLGVLGFIAFLVLHELGPPLPPALYADLIEHVPMPHHVPPNKGGASFRFAMAHDVIHERFPKHGPTYHRERVRITREKLKALHADAPLALSLTDDLAAAHARLGEYSVAIALMRGKVARQRALLHEGTQLYTTYANLGTFLTYDAFDKAAAGDEVARGQFRVGVSYLQAAIKSNPNAHFGREKWQAGTAEYLLAAIERSDLLRELDCLGNALVPHPKGSRSAIESRGFTGMGRRGQADVLWDAFRGGARFDDPDRWEELKNARKWVTKVGAEANWEALAFPSHPRIVPFDEAMLGLVGLWRQGGGPNAHFALAIGETMLRVGQRRIAFAAYTRAQRLAGSFWPDESVRERFRTHCQERIESISELYNGEDAPTEAEFEAELAHGEAYQQEYQAYENRKIAAGTSIDDKTFFDDFHAGRDPIASPSGEEEWFAFVPRAKRNNELSWRIGSLVLVVMGVIAMAAALLSRYWPRYRVTPPQPQPGEATPDTPQ